LIIDTETGFTPPSPVLAALERPGAAFPGLETSREPDAEVPGAGLFGADRQAHVAVTRRRNVRPARTAMNPMVQQSGTQATVEEVYDAGGWVSQVVQEAAGMPPNS